VTRWNDPANWRARAAEHARIAGAHVEEAASIEAAINAAIHTQGATRAALDYAAARRAARALRGRAAYRRWCASRDNEIAEQLALGVQLYPT
jgi:hypothetical protein